MKPVVAIVAAGNMGAGIARRLVENGVTVLTLLNGRSAATQQRATSSMTSAETSSPGITGQSGGSLFDTRGTLWGVQSRTDMHSIRILTRTKGKARPGDEVLPLNLGVAIHPELLVRYLTDNGIRFRMSDY